jgi:hypothetical protein
LLRKSDPAAGSRSRLTLSAGAGGHRLSAPATPPGLATQNYARRVGGAGQEFCGSPHVMNVALIFYLINSYVIALACFHTFIIIINVIMNELPHLIVICFDNILRTISF